MPMPTAIHCCWAARITNAINAAIYKNLNYDPVGDFTPVASIAVDSSALVISPSIPAQTVQGFVGYLKDKPGKLTSGAVLGIAPHVMVEYFKVVTGTNMVFVPYKGGPALLPDLLSGQIQMTFGAKSLFLPYIQSGKLRPLAVTSDARWPELPDVPTMSQCGFANFPAYQWFMVFAPARTPAAVIDKLNAAINDGLKSPDVQLQLAKLGTEPRIRSQQDLVKFMAEEANNGPRWFLPPISNSSDSRSPDSSALTPSPARHRSPAMPRTLAPLDRDAASCVLCAKSGFG